MNLFGSYLQSSFSSFTGKTIYFNCAKPYFYEFNTSPATCVKEPNTLFQFSKSKKAPSQNLEFGSLNFDICVSPGSFFQTFSGLLPQSNCSQFPQFLSLNATFHFIPRLPGSFPARQGKNIFENGTFPGKQGRLLFTPGTCPLSPGKFLGKRRILPGMKGLMPFSMGRCPTSRGGPPGDPGMLFRNPGFRA